MNEPGHQFLHDNNPRLHASSEVEAVSDYLRQGGEDVSQKPTDKIAHYVGFLANSELANDGILTGDKDSIERQVDAKCIEAEDVPESYFKLQERILAEMGFGIYRLSGGERAQHARAVVDGQRTSLTAWAKYLSSDHAYYPDWFKLHAWESVTKMGVHDREKHVFQKRTKSTTAPFPELNQEALAKTFDAISSERINHEPYEPENQDPAFRSAMASGNFNKIYAQQLAWIAETAALADNKETEVSVKGEWRVFARTNDTGVAVELSATLEGHNTGWCTASPATAAGQLEEGDFYVFYSENKDGEPVHPRLAIRTGYDGQVIEVRGVQGHQEIEGSMLDTAMAKLETLPGGDKYFNKVEDMRKVTELTDRFEQDPNAPVTPEEVRFIYEMDKVIECFGEEDDPRIQELRKTRDTVHDMEVLLGRQLNRAEPDAELLHLKDEGHGDVAYHLIGNIGILDGKTIVRLAKDEKFKQAVLSQHSAWDDAEEALAAKVFYNLESFSGIQSATMKEILKYKSTFFDFDKLVADNAERFTKKAYSLYLDSRMDSMDTWEIADNLPRFTELGVGIAKRLIHSGEEDLVFTNLRCFSKEARNAIRRYKSSYYNFEDIDD